MEVNKLVDVFDSFDHPSDAYDYYNISDSLLD